MGLRVDAAHFILAGFDHGRGKPHVAGNADRVGKIILSLLVGVSDFLQDLERMRAVEGHHSGIA